MKKENRVIFRALSLISQVGITLLTTVFIGIYIGTKMDGHFGTSYWFPIWLVIGLLAGFQNIFKMVRCFYAKDKEKEDQELAYFESLRKTGNQDTESKSSVKNQGNTNREKE
ncbi:AtpZ/AtpI family protein [Anaerosporobacter faecicola]|uniref:AtpZ/AtpI family protein n=1 Tax=Anaerosporobacter faecicola TaxID=2718714 RepID=UPI0014392156|nr:AtpZ/AtpI family protein [Anaerosporobacter faecicola]